jgi:hypothetical protein
MAGWVAAALTVGAIAAEGLLLGLLTEALLRLVHQEDLGARDE